MCGAYVPGNGVITLSVVFRVDASVNMGVGHVMRCLTLADELKRQRVDTQFVTREHNGHLVDTIQARGHKTTLLPAPASVYQPSQGDVMHAWWLGVSWEQDAKETRQAIAGFKSGWLVVDHYGIDARWHNALRERGMQVLAIDDLADRPLNCNILLDQTYGRQKDDYTHRVSTNCRMLLGSRYALLRPKFFELRPLAFEKRKNFKGINRILVSMGGMDSGNVTNIVLEGLAKVKWPSSFIVDVVLGSKAPHLHSVKQWIEKSPFNAIVSTDVDDMAECMLKADLAIGAGGTTSWERCCLGLPTIMISIADNQTIIAREIEKAGASIYLGDIRLVTSFSIQKALQSLNEEMAQMKNMSDSCFHMLDALGANRVVKQMGYAI